VHANTGFGGRVYLYPATDLNPARAFLDVNRRLSFAIASVLPQQQDMPEVRYAEFVVRAIRRKPDQLVVDVGGGKTLRYAEWIAPGEARIVAVDISEAELSVNEHVSETRVGDVTKHMPFEDAEVDVITSSSVLEHLPDVDGFFAEASRVLKEGGVMIHVFPGRYAPFAVLNRMLPESAKRWLLFRLYPETRGLCGFRAFYHYCYFDAMVRECEQNDFEIVSAVPGYFGSSFYVTVFFPLFLLTRLWELAAWAFRARNLAAQVTIEARRLPRNPAK
jgi:ubiquinone/menaquinone biosynthesis C-methylase UbiE